MTPADVRGAVAHRRRLIESVAAPDGMAPEQERLLRKAVSVMKVNVCSATGTIQRRWSTPDRWPHRHLWLWDSAFHAVGMAPLDTALAQDEVLAVLEAGREDGMVPHMIQADGRCSQITQPPLLAWAALHVLEQGGDLHWARQCAPLLQRYLDWDRSHRDRNHNHLPEWHIEGDPRCRCGESGLDNSSVYDRAVLLDAPDFAAFLFNDYQCLAEIAERLGDVERAERCRAAAAPIAWAVERELWQESEGLYFHRDHQGALVPVKTVAGFMPLFAGIPTAARAARLAKHLCDPTTFGAPAQVPSEALDSGTFCKDMWRGPAWMNLSYLIVLGLRRYGLCAEAEALKDNLLATVQYWYGREGCLFEFYDSLGLTSPRDLDRKQRLTTGTGIAPIADYHWTAAVTAALLLE
jgi:glycogen debranching enzyme